jgi:hypothetical protein
MIASESTAFTLDMTERASCNALQEALESPAQTMPGRSDFDLTSRRALQCFLASL